MYILFSGASLKIAKNLIQAGGIRDCWTLFLEKSQGTLEKRKLLKEILGLSACNLSQAMKETSVEREIDEEDRQDLLDDYIVENLRLQDWINFVDGAERMGTCQEIEAVWERLRQHFSRTREAQGFKPTLEAVNDVMRNLGADDHKPLKAALLEFFETQHRFFMGYFRGLLEPFSILEENSSTAPSLVLEPEATEEPRVEEKPEVQEETLPQVESVASTKTKTPAEISLLEPALSPKEKVEEKEGAPPNLLVEPPTAMEPEAFEEPRDQIEIPLGEPALFLKEKEEEKESAETKPLPGASLEALREALAKPQDRMEIPIVEPVSSLEEKGEEREAAEPFPATEPIPKEAGVRATDPTARSAPFSGAEDFLFLEALDKEEKTLPPPAETVPLPEPLGAMEQSAVPGVLKEPVPKKDAGPPMEEMVHIERPFSKSAPGSSRAVDPRKLAQVFDILLALDPDADIKPIPPSHFQRPLPPKEPLPPALQEGPMEPPFPTS